MVLIALLWFWAGLNISSWITKKQLTLPSSRLPRLLSNMLILFFGILCAVYAWSGTYEPGIINWIQGDLFFMEEHTPLDLVIEFMATICYLVWAVVLIVFFGRDFVKTFVPRTSRQISETPQNTK